MALTTIVAGCDLSVQGDAARRAARPRRGGARRRSSCSSTPSPTTSHPSTSDNALAQKLGEISATVRAAEAVKLADKLSALLNRGIAAELVEPGRSARRGASAGRRGTRRRAARRRDARPHRARAVPARQASRPRRCVTRRATCWCAAARRPVCSHGRWSPSTSPPAATRAIGHVAELVAVGGVKPAIDLVHAWQLPTGSWARRCSGRRGSRGRRSARRGAVLGARSARSARRVAGQARSRATRRAHPGPPASAVTALRPSAAATTSSRWARTAHRGSGDCYSVASRRMSSGTRGAPVLVVHGEHAGGKPRSDSGKVAAGRPGWPRGGSSFVSAAILLSSFAASSAPGSGVFCSACWATVTCAGNARLEMLGPRRGIDLRGLLGTAA